MFSTPSLLIHLISPFSALICFQYLLPSLKSLYFHPCLWQKGEHLSLTNVVKKTKRSITSVPQYCTSTFSQYLEEEKCFDQCHWRMGCQGQASARFTSFWLSSALSAPQFVSGAPQPCCEDPLTSSVHVSLMITLKPEMGLCPAGGDFLEISQDLFCFLSSLDSWWGPWWEIFKAAIGIYSSRRTTALCNWKLHLSFGFKI